MSCTEPVKYRSRSFHVCQIITPCLRRRDIFHVKWWQPCRPSSFDILCYHIWYGRNRRTVNTNLCNLESWNTPTRLSPPNVVDQVSPLSPALSVSLILKPTHCVFRFFRDRPAPAEIPPKRALGCSLLRDGLEWGDKHHCRSRDPATSHVRVKSSFYLPKLGWVPGLSDPRWDQPER